jgi:hypothetical protein
MFSDWRVISYGKLKLFFVGVTFSNLIYSMIFTIVASPMYFPSLVIGIISAFISLYIGEYQKKVKKARGLWYEV